MARSAVSKTLPGGPVPLQTPGHLKRASHKTLFTVSLTLWLSVLPSLMAGHLMLQSKDLIEQVPKDN